jgi:hypothetical protein
MELEVGALKGGQAAIIFSFAMGVASRKVCIRHQTPTAQLGTVCQIESRAL